MDEKGFTMVGNKILEEITKRKFNGTQLKIIMIIWRLTFGYQRESHHISLTYLAEALGIDKSQIRKELSKLFNEKILTETQKATFNVPRKIKFNKNHLEWTLAYSGQNQGQSTNQHTVNRFEDTTLAENTSSTVDLLIPTSVDKSVHQEINEINKKNINKDEDYNDLIVF